MKKIVKLLTLSLIPLLICSCNGTNNSKENSNETLSSNEVLSDNSEEVSSMNSYTSREYQARPNKKYTSTTWDNNINKMLEYVLEDKATNVPAFIATSYEAIILNSVIQEQETTVFSIKCFGVNSTSASKLYSEKMVEKGFNLSAGNSYGYLMKDYYSDIFLTYELVTEDDNSYFSIQTFILNTREKEWNTTMVTLYSDMQVPSYDAPCFQTTYDQSYDRLTIYALFVGKNAANEYVSTLRSNRYSVSQTDSTGAVQLVDPTGYLTITVYQTYGDYNCDALYISISNAWPTLAIYSFTGISGLPKLDSLTARYDGYTYVDSVGNGDEKDYTVCMYFVNASTTDYGNYINTLVKLGFSKSDSETSESGIISTYLYYFTKDSYKITLRMLYKVSTSEICLVVYQSEPINQ